MKNIILLIACCVVSAFAYSEPFNYNPFSKILPLIEKHSSEATKLSKKKAIEIGGIMKNKAFINGKWYKVGDKIGTYKINKVSHNMVSLKKGKHIKVIKANKYRNVLRIKEKE